MIVHVLLLQPKPETTHEEMLNVLDQVKALKDKIPGIIDIQTSQNRNPNNYGYTYGFVMSFVDEEHLKVYSPHPEHRAVSAQLRRLCSTLLNFDYLPSSEFQD